MLEIICRSQRRQRSPALRTNILQEEKRPWVRSSIKRSDSTLIGIIFTLIASHCVRHPPSESSTTSNKEKKGTNSPARDTLYAMIVRNQKKKDQRSCHMVRRVKREIPTNKWAHGARLYDARARTPRRIDFPDTSSGGRSMASMQIAQSPNGPPSVSGSGGW